MYLIQPSFVHKYTSQHSVENHLHHLQFTSVWISSCNQQSFDLPHWKWHDECKNECDCCSSWIDVSDLNSLLFSITKLSLKLYISHHHPASSAQLPLSSSRNIQREKAAVGEVITESQHDFTTLLLHHIRRHQWINVTGIDAAVLRFPFSSVTYCLSIAGRPSGIQTLFNSWAIAREIISN